MLLSNTLTHQQQVQLGKLEKRLRRHVGQAIAQYNMIEDGDRIMACLLTTKTLRIETEGLFYSFSRNRFKNIFFIKQLMKL